MRDLLEKLDAILSETDLDDLKDHPAADDPKIKKAINDKEKEQQQDDDVDESDSGRTATDDEAKKSLDKLAKMPEFKSMAKSLKRRDQDSEYDEKKKADFIKSLSKKQESVLPTVGDAFDISLSEDYNIESFIVEATDDAIVIELDQTAIDYLEQNGARLSEETHGNSKIYDKCWKGYRKVPGKKRGEKGSCVKIKEAEYQGRKVTLNKPTSNPDGKSKSKVYVKDPKTGNVRKITFGDPDMRIKKSNPERRKSFRARHKCDSAKDKTTARYWSCRAW